MNIKDLLLAIPSVSRRQRKEIIESMSHLPIHVQTIPGMADLVSGKARIEEIKDVDIEDLLGRNPVDPDDNLMHANIRGRVVMVTGAGGSIGSELCRQIVKLNPKMLLLFEQSEFALYQIVVARLIQDASTGEPSIGLAQNLLQLVVKDHLVLCKLPQ